MLHAANRCMSPCSYTRLGKEGREVFRHGPVVVTKGDSVMAVAMSVRDAAALEAYIEATALSPLLDERRAMESCQIIAHSEHTGESVGSIAMAIQDWNRLYAGTRQGVANQAVRPTKGYFGATEYLSPDHEESFQRLGTSLAPSDVLHYDGIYVVRQSHVQSLRADDMVIVVYFVFRKESAGSNFAATLLGIKAGYRQYGTFDPSKTGPFFTDEALTTFFEWQKQTSEKSGDKFHSGIGPTKSEMESDFYRQHNAR